MANDQTGVPSTTPEALPTDSETDEGSMHPVSKKDVERMPGAGAPTADEAEGEGEGSDAADRAASEMDKRDQRI